MSSRDYDNYDRRSSRDRDDRRYRHSREEGSGRSKSSRYSRDYDDDRRSSSRRRSRSPYVDEDDWRRRKERDIKRSGSPYENGGNIKHEIKEEDLGYWSSSGHLIIDGYQINGTLSGFNEDEKRSLSTLHCELCDVKLGDPDSMRGHIRGRNHLQEKKNKGQYIPGMNMKVEDNDRNFWTQQDNKIRIQQASRTTLDNDYSDKKSNFTGKRYDMGQFNKSRYCGICGVTVHSRDTMENHIQGAEHKRRAKKPELFECKICFIRVPCQNTLNSHLQGKDHIKRMKDEAIRKQRGENSELSSDGIAELKQVKTDVKNLQTIFDKHLEKEKKCKTEHKDADNLTERKKKLENELKRLEEKYEKGKTEKMRLMKERDRLRSNPDFERRSPPPKPEYEEVSQSNLKKERKVNMEDYLNNIPCSSTGKLLMKPKKEEYAEVITCRPKKEELFDRVPHAAHDEIEVIDID